MGVNHHGILALPTKTAIKGRFIEFPMRPALRTFALGFLALVQFAAGRTTDGLVVYYDFADGEGKVVHDRSGAGEPLDLEIQDPNAVRRAPGELEITGDTKILSKDPPNKLLDGIGESNALSIEAWIRPAESMQEGPARIVTFSKDTSNRNFTLGQDRDKYDFRLRTTKRSNNGIPSIPSNGNMAKPEITHVVYTRDASGNAAIFLNGKEAGKGKVPGETRNWDKSYQLGLGNEASGGRFWKGTFYQVAIYSRALGPQEIKENFEAGANSGLAPSQESLARVFESKVAPILSEHCLECHDSATRKGKLDLSRKDTAFAGGREGLAITPGKSSESLLWEMIQSDEMPAKRTPLSPEEKHTLKTWIDSGAEWSLEIIDPADFRHLDASQASFVQRLTSREYIDTVRHATGVDISEEALALLPKDLRADGFSNTAYNLSVDLKHITAYAQLAEKIAQRIDLGAFLEHFQIHRDFTDKNMGKAITEIGKWVLRGPLADEELAAYLEIPSTTGRLGGNFDQALRYVLEAMLQSPRFVYRIERQQGSLDNYELASRMSYILWGAPPDLELFRAAGAGKLADPEKAREQVRRMIQNPLAISRSQQFLYDWLNLGRLDNLRPDPKHFPGWSPQLATEMRNETLAYFEEVAWKQKRPLADLMNTSLAIVPPNLARHYGWQPKGSGTARYSLQNIPGRGGLLTQGSVLSIGGDQASMVSRGLFILQDILRGTVKDPPPCVDTTPVPEKAGLTKRGIAEQRISNKSCGGCHAKFEPLAFGLEKFDGTGAYHESDHFGNRLREDGNILVPGTSRPIAYQSVREFMDHLANSPRVAESLTWKIAQFALGRPLAAPDRPEIEKIHQAATEAGGTYGAVLEAIVMSDLVRKRRNY